MGEVHKGLAFGVLDTPGCSPNRPRPRHALRHLRTGMA